MSEERLNRKITKLLRKVGTNQTLNQITMWQFLFTLRDGRNSEESLKLLQEMIARLPK